MLSGLLDGVVISMSAWVHGQDGSYVDDIIHDVKSTESFAEDFMADVEPKTTTDHPKSKGCTVSLFNLLSCLIDDLSRATEDLENAAKNLLESILPEITGLTSHLLDDFKNNDDDDSSQSSSSTTSSCSTTSAACTESCLSVLSGTNSCTTICPSITGSCVSLATTSTKTSVITTSSYDLQIYPIPPKESEDELRSLSAHIASQFRQMGLMPITAIGSMGTSTGTVSIPSSTENPGGIIASLLNNTSLRSSTSPTKATFHTTVTGDKIIPGSTILPSSTSSAVVPLSYPVTTSMCGIAPSRTGGPDYTMNMQNLTNWIGAFCGSNGDQNTLLPANNFSYVEQYYTAADATSGVATGLYAAVIYHHNITDFEACPMDAANLCFGDTCEDSYQTNECINILGQILMSCESLQLSAMKTSDIEGRRQWDHDTEAWRVYRPRVHR